MQIQFIGAAKTVTGSMHLIKVNGTKILLDCGMYQGKRKESFEKNRKLEFIEPESIDYVILSHAHIDHSGNLPQLSKNKFKGTVFSTFATRDLAHTMLLDSAFIQKKDVEFVNKKRTKNHQNLFEPLYLEKDVYDIMEQFQAVSYRKEYHINSNVSFIFYDAGHILGSAITVLNIKENGRHIRLAFTGDLGRPYRPILKDPQLTGNVNILITESTYGGRYHPDNESAINRLQEVINKAYERRGKIIVPAFSLGRTQELVFDLHKLKMEKKIPDFPIYVDSPLSSNVTEIFRMHPECFDHEIREMLVTERDPFGFVNLKYITDVEESKKLNSLKEPCMIISASGMCESGRILHHLANNIEDPNNMILMTGYCAENTLGKRIIEKDKKLKILGDEYNVNAEIQVLNYLSGHADKDELLGYISHMDRNDMEEIFIVHGDPDQQLKLKDGLQIVGFKKMIIPDPGEEFYL
jgi:metallo-beta-lactamase family protein